MKAALQKILNIAAQRSDAEVWNIANKALNLPSPKRKALAAVLRGGRQCDEEGAEIIMSRQACLEAADLLETEAGWEQVARAQDAKLHAMTDQPGGIEKLREVLAQAEK